MQALPLKKRQSDDFVRINDNGVLGYEPSVLTQIYDAQIAMCILKRSINPDIRTYMAHLQQKYMGFELRRQISMPNLAEVLKVSLPQYASSINFIEDVVMVADMFSCLFGLERIGLRLSVLNKTMCPRFHTDKVPCRLITTYAGKGTEWLDLAMSDYSAQTACNETNAEHGTIRSLDEGDIALLKGENWEGNEGLGIIHRSPVLAANETRVLLTLDLFEF